MAITAQFDADFSAFNAEVGKAEQGLTKLESTTAQTGTQVNTLSGSFRQFDGVLNAVGIHLGPAVKGLEDIGAAAGKSVTELGLFGTAGLVAGAAMAGWTAGRGAVSMLKWFGVDIDEAIRKATVSLLGWADVVAETAAAKQDVLDRATKNAGRTITDFNEALRINQKTFDDHLKGIKADAKASEEWAAAMAAVTVAGQNNDAVLKTIAASTVAAAKAALEHGVNMDTVATAYRLTASQIAAVEAALKAEQEAMKASEKEHARITAELKQHWDAVLAIRDEALGVGAIEKATQWTEAIFLLGNSVDKLSHEQLVALQAAMTEAMTAMARNGNLTMEQALQFNDFAAAAAAAAAALKPVQAEATATADAIASIKAPAEEAAAAIQGINDEMEKLQNIGTKLPGSQQTTDSMGKKYLVSPTGQRVPLGEHGELPGNWFEQYTGQSNFQEAYSPLLNSGRILGGGQTSNVVQINSGAVQMTFPIMNNPQAMDQLANVMSDAIMSRITRTGTKV